MTDLSMPAVEDGQGEKGLRYAGEPVPYGYPLALVALKSGVPKVAIVSNGQMDNHHNHPMFWTADFIRGEIIPGRLWGFGGYDSPTMDDNTLPGVDKPHHIKDWATVLKIITAE